MKSWGTRLVEGLKNWRMRNSEAVPDTGRGEQKQTDHEPVAKTSIKPTPKESRASQQVDPANTSADPHRANDYREARTPGTASDQLEQTKREAKELSSSTSGLKAPPKQSGAKPAKVGGQPKPGKEPTAQEEATADQISDREMLVSSATTRPGQYPKKHVTGKVLRKRSGRTGGKAGSGPSSEEVVAVTGAKMLPEQSNGQLSPIREATERNASTPVVPAFPQKRSRLRKPESADVQVTDEQLAELEAENVRLKLLLREKLTRS
ncbi:hypothetical protein JS562_40925 [Agrobacterium sp. S2]|nr:hypothetical protein [Agrobacterium sp. S2]